MPLSGSITWRAIDRYKDALFYLNRDTSNDEIRIAGAEQLDAKSRSLRARIRSSQTPPDDKASGTSAAEKTLSIDLTKSVPSVVVLAYGAVINRPVVISLVWHL